MKRRRKKKNDLLFCTGLFWTLLTAATLFFTGESAAALETNGGEALGKQYLADSFLTVSRGENGWQRQPLGTDEGAPDAATDGSMNGQQTGGSQEEHKETDTAQKEEIAVSAPLSGEEGEEPGATENAAETGVFTAEPVVLIYHTHASESYQPYTESNFHREEKEGTVREAGDILTAALEAKGIGVVHDTTLHDRPSYDQSYSRSLERAKGLLQQNPTVKIVIDLHRDAAAYSGNKGHVFVTADGGTAAQFALVVGQGNGNAAQLNAFAKEIHQLANRLYPGFSRGIIEKDYRYNQYISDCHLLLELGNNQNSIEDIRRSAALFAEVLAAWLKES